MEVADFILNFMSAPGRRFNDMAENDMPWSWRLKFAQLTEHINYNCDFDPKTKICKGSTSHMACCGSCGRCLGYIACLPSDIILMKEIAPLFIKTDDALALVRNDWQQLKWQGFWKEGIGCTLPRRFRSTVCLTTKCSQSANLNRHEKYHLALISSAHYIKSKDIQQFFDIHSDVMESAYSRVFKKLCEYYGANSEDYDNKRARSLPNYDREWVRNG